MSALRYLMNYGRLKYYDALVTIITNLIDSLESTKILEYARGIYQGTERLHRQVENALLYAKFKIAALCSE